MVPADSNGVSPAPPYSGAHYLGDPCSYGGLTLYAGASQRLPIRITPDNAGPTTPRHLRTAVWAPPLSLATTRGIIIIFSSSGYLDVSVPRVRPAEHTPGGPDPHGSVGCPIRIPRDQRSLAPPPGFSQLATSFLASDSLGIPRAPFFRFLALDRYNTADTRPRGPISNGDVAQTCHVIKRTPVIPGIIEHHSRNAHLTIPPSLSKNTSCLRVG